MDSRGLKRDDHELAIRGRTIVGICRFLESDEQPLFSAIGAVMEQARRLVLGEVVESRFDYVCCVLSDGEANALRSFIDRALDDLIIVRGAVGIVAAYNSFFIDGQLNGDIRFLLVGLRKGEDAQREPVAVRRSVGHRSGAGQGAGLVVILLGCSCLLTIDVDVVTFVDDVRAVVIVDG